MSAAAKLVGLTGSKKAETARKACLDIISSPRLSATKSQGAVKPEAAGGQEGGQLSAETASKVLGVLAEGKNKEEKNKKFNKNGKLF